MTKKYSPERKSEKSAKPGTLRDNEPFVWREMFLAADSPYPRGGNFTIRERISRKSLAGSEKGKDRSDEFRSKSRGLFLIK